jgi:flagellar protein FlaF
MPGNPLEAYGEVEKSTLSGRELEALVLSKAANILKSVQNRWNEPERNQQLDDALRYNQKLWSLFQSDLASADNPLPVEVRQNLLNLSIFIDKRTFHIIMERDPDPSKLDILISINRNIAAGLRGEVVEAPG